MLLCRNWTAHCRASLPGSGSTCSPQSLSHRAEGWFSARLKMMYVLVRRGIIKGTWGFSGESLAALVQRRAREKVAGHQFNWSGPKHYDRWSAVVST